MNDIRDVVITNLEKSKYVKPLTMHFTQNGTQRTWDMLSVHESVAIIIYNITKEKLVFVKQFRPAVYYAAVPPEDRISNIDVSKYPADLGITLELCAGIVDKNLSLVEIAKEEILEETGYEVSAERIQFVSSYASGVGTSGAYQNLYYCEVTDDMKTSQGGGVDDEIIDVVEMSIPDIKKYIHGNDIKSPPSFMYGIYWFLYNKKK